MPRNRYKLYFLFAPLEDVKSCDSNIEGRQRSRSAEPNLSSPGRSIGSVSADVSTPTKKSSGHGKDTTQKGKAAPSTASVTKLSTKSNVSPTVPSSQKSKNIDGRNMDTRQRERVASVAVQRNTSVGMPRRRLAARVSPTLMRTNARKEAEKKRDTKEREYSKEEEGAQKFTGDRLSRVSKSTTITSDNPSSSNSQPGQNEESVALVKSPDALTGKGGRPEPSVAVPPPLPQVYSNICLGGLPCVYMHICATSHYFWILQGV